jgi:hypothetical protein
MGKVTARFVAHSGGSHQRTHGKPAAPGAPKPAGVPKKASVETATAKSK